MTNANIAKQYAIYHRFISLRKEKRQLYRLRTINLTEIQEMVAEEFGLSAKSVRVAVKYITDNLNSPYVRKEILLFNENNRNYFAIYGSDEDVSNIELIEKSIKKTKSTKTAFTFYFIYKRYYELIEQGKTSTGAFNLLADEFYYTNTNSVRNVVKQVKNILSCESDLSLCPSCPSPSL